MMKLFWLAILVHLVLAPVLLRGQESSKPKPSILRPVPKEAMDEMYTDRPGNTETPFVVDAGHLQIETDLSQYSRRKDDATRENTLFFNRAIIKVGLFNKTDIEIGIDSYGRKEETDLSSGERETKGGAGDITLRIKRGLIGSPQTVFALSVLPYVTFPTARYDDSRRYEGGIMVPMNLQLSDNWSIGMQLEGDRKRDDDNERAVHTEFMQSVSLNHEFTKKIQGALESYYTYAIKDHHLTNYLNAAVQVEVVHDLKVDLGLNYGLQHDAERAYFLGASVRF